MSDPIIGIDLGTSNTVVAFADPGGAAKVLADDAGYKIHPSVVSFHPNGGVVVGAAAKQRKVIDPQNTIYSVKRLIGRTFDSVEVQTAKARVPYQIKEGENHLPLIATRGGEFAIPEISAIVLDHARNVAATRLGREVTRSVVTVPASFSEAQRSATATAGAIAGLTVVRVLNEPTAAALAYGHSRNLREIIAVYDFGGGTFDITLLKLEDQVYEVLGTAGDTFLGGDDLDERLVDKMVAKFLAENRIDLRSNEISMMRLRAVAEQTKIELSRRSRAVVRIDEIAYGPRGAPLNLQIEVTRDELVASVSDLIDRTFPVCQEALALAGIGTNQIADVILVGGTTKIPYVRDQVSRFFEKAPRTDVNPEDAVAIGAALQATSLERILARPRTSSKVDIPAVRPSAELPSAEEPTQTDANLKTPADPTAGRVKRPTAGYPTKRPSTESPAITRQTGQTAAASPSTTQPLGSGARGIDAPWKSPAGDTSYSVTRGVAQERIENKTPAPTPTPPAIGRLTKTMTPVAGSRQTGNQPALPPPIPGARPSQPRQSVQTQPLPTVTKMGPAVSPEAKFEAEEATRPRPPSVPPPRGKPWVDEDQLKTNPMDPVVARSTTDRGSIPVLPPGARTMVAQLPIAPPPAAALDLGIAPESDPDDDFTTEPGAAGDPSAQSTAKGMPPAVTAPPIRYITPPAYLPQSQPVVQAPQPVPRPAPISVPPPIAPRPAPISVPPPIAAEPPPPVRAPAVLDVTPRSLGIATVAGYCEELIRRNARVPTEMKRIFTTSRDSQEHVRIVVCQGESRRIDNNVVIGDLVLQNLPKRPRGETSIEVTFMLDVSGILQVRARDALTGKEQSATLDVLGNVPAQDVAAARDRVAGLRR